MFSLSRALQMTLLAAQLRACAASAFLPVLAIDAPSPALRQALAAAAATSPAQASPSGPSRPSSGPRVARGPAMPSRDALAAAKAQALALNEPLLEANAAAAALPRGPALPPALVAPTGRFDDNSDDDDGPVLPGAKGDWAAGGDGPAEDDEAEAAAAAKRRRMDSEWALVREKGLSATDAAAQVGEGYSKASLDLEHGKRNWLERKDAEKKSRSGCLIRVQI